MNIGSINIVNPIALAPMEDVTDHPFRSICKELGADILYTEFVNSEGLIRDSEKTHRKMFFTDDERPFGIQIYGGLETSMERAAQLAEALSPEFIDINCGCWVKNIAMRGAGAGLLKDLPRMERIISSVVKAVSLPVTVKTRLGWDSETIRIVEVAQMVEQTGAKALTIHCRTRAQGHKGEPDYTWLPKIKEKVSIPIIANGGLNTPEKIKNVFEESGCNGVMIGSGAIDNPWIFQQAKDYLATGSYRDVNPPERIDLLIRHLRKSVDYKGERKGVIEFRKHYSGYLKGIPYAAKLRGELMQFTDLSPILDCMQQFKNAI